MSGEQTHHTDRLDFASSLMFGYREMLKEAAVDGFERQFEDLLDLFLASMVDLIDTDGNYQMWKAIDVDRWNVLPEDYPEYGIKKRERIMAKIELAFRTLAKHHLLLRYVTEYKWNFDPESIDAEE